MDPLSFNEESSKIQKKYEDILKKNGIPNKIEKITVKNSNLHGEGFSSVSQHICIAFDDVTKTTLHLFEKRVPNNEFHQKVIKDSKFFDKEARFYNDLAPAARKLCELKGQQELLKFLPKCFYADDATIVLEDLMNLGYKTVSREEMQDENTAKLSLTTLAKLHAVSHAMIQQHGGPKQFFERFQNLDFDRFTQPAVQATFSPILELTNTSCIKLLESNNILGKKEALDILKAQCGKSYQSLVNSLNQTEDLFMVLNHGDYWTDNIMLLKDGQEHISDIKIIDFQITRYNSPAVDIAYFLYTSVNSEVRRKNLKEFLQIYLNTLKTTSSQLGYEIQLELEDFYRQYREKFTYGFWFAFGTANEAGQTVMKEVDFKALTGLGDWAVQLELAITKWIDTNTEKVNQLGENIVQLLKEYMDLIL